MLWHNSIITIKKDEVDMNSNSSLFRGKLLITLTALFTAALLTTSCGYSISDSAMEEIKLFLLQLPLNTDCL